MDTRRLALIALVGVAGALAGCGTAKPVPYHSAQEIPQGPGMLSGDEGAFVFRVGGSAPAKSMSPAINTPPSGSREEFEAFREYQKWKGTAGSGAELREFQDWREWQEWRKKR